VEGIETAGRRWISFVNRQLETDRRPGSIISETDRQAWQEIGSLLGPREIPFGDAH